jgi:mannose-6-phosphate isomerase-like protein (cupin superfamily)
MYFNKNCFDLARKNTFFRHVLTTTEKSQIVLMSVPAGNDIGEEIHDVDQILFFVSGEGNAILNGEASAVHSESVVVVPAGTKHNFINTGSTDLKLFTIYAPPHHRQGVIHKTKADAAADTSDHY